MLNIDFDPYKEPHYVEMQEIFNSLKEKALSSNHYDLVKLQGEADYTEADWKEFITDPRVALEINNELELIRTYKIKQVISQLSANSNSVGTAQILNSLNNMNNNRPDKTGPVFVYCYIPLNAAELQAQAVKELNSDPFFDLK